LAGVSTRLRRAALTPADRDAHDSVRPVSAGLSNATTARLLQGGGGQSIPDQARTELEAGLGAPLDHVRVHTGAAAAGLAEGLNARAFTVGGDIYFGAGQYAPATATGYRLLAHEVAHTAQPDGPVRGDLTVGSVNAPEEAAADRFAEQVTGAGPDLAGHPGMLLGLQRSAGNAATARLVRRAVVSQGGSAPPDIAGRADYERLVAEYRTLMADGKITPVARQDADPAVLAGSEAISTVEIVYARTGSSGVTAGGWAAGALAAAGFLAADDATVIGVLDDPLIVPALAVAAGAGVVAALQRASANHDRAAALDAARETLRQVTTTIADIVFAAKVGDQIRSHTGLLALHLARILGSEVAGMPPDHQNDPERDKPHWWTEVLNFVKQITKHGLSPKQLWRELSKEYTREQIEAIIAALRKAAEALGKDPPDFPPVAFP
jgi:hypothetical protein